MPSPDFTPIHASEARRIAQHALLSPGQAGLDIETAQVQHRLEVINSWGIEPGSRVLEVGCGQGNCTTVLAEFVGPAGHVDALDPASPDYGAPFTLGQAQEHISRGPMGGRITWHNRDLAEYLALPENSAQTWDYIVFCHSLWYVKSPEQAAELVDALRSRGCLLVAEYALQATEPRALPHVLAAIARGSLEALKTTSDENIQSLLAPREIKRLVEDHGWSLSMERIIVPGEHLLDGSWEVLAVKSESFLKEIGHHVRDTRVQLVLRSSRDAVLYGLGQISGQQVRTMDVWAASFKWVG